jgi:HK97 family phage portal protein
VASSLVKFGADWRIPHKVPTRSARIAEEKELFIERSQISQSVYSLTAPYVIGYDAARALYSNVVMAPVFWMMRVFTEARLRIQNRSDKVWGFVEDHDIELLIDTPNQAYDGDALWKSTICSYNLDGNAYWWKIRNRFGDVIQLWYLPHWMVRPEYNLGRSGFIDYYTFTPNGIAGSNQLNANQQIAPRDMVHFRFGVDLENPRVGISPLRALLQEVFTDDEAARFSTAILKNMGVPGLIVSPKIEAGNMNPDQIKQMKQEVVEASTGRNRGNTMVFGKPTDLVQFGFDPNKLMLGNLRDIAEERVCAVLGIPAAVVGFGSGLQSTKVGATMRELVRLAWNTCMIPMQKSLANQLTHQLMPDFVAQTRRFRARFDTSDVSAFQEEIDIKSKTILEQVREGVLRVDRAQEALGLEVDRDAEGLLTSRRRRAWSTRMAIR